MGRQIDWSVGWKMCEGDCGIAGECRGSCDGMGA